MGRGLGWVGVLKSVEMLRSGRVRIVPVVRAALGFGCRVHQGGGSGCALSIGAARGRPHLLVAATLQHDSLCRPLVRYLQLSASGQKTSCRQR